MKVLQTYNPLLEEKEITGGLFARPPIAYGGTGYIMVGPNYSSVVSENTPATPSQMRKGKFHHQIKIDLNSHNLKGNFVLYAKDQVYQFSITIGANAIVRDPIAVYQAGLHDAGILLEKLLELDLCGIAKDYTMDEWHDLQKGLSDFLDRRFHSVQECGIEFSNFAVSVEVDDKFRDHMGNKDAITRSAELETLRICKANELANQLVDDWTAAYADVLSGKLSLEDALKHVRANDIDQFNANLGKLQSFREIYRGLVEDGILTESQAGQKLQEQIAVLAAPTAAPSGSRQLVGAAARQESLLAGDNDNALRPIEDDEDFLN